METKAVESKTVIVVEQANPQVVYVPSYNPTVVYGPPVYPYPPIYYPPPGYYAAGIGNIFWRRSRHGRLLGWRVGDMAAAGVVTTTSPSTTTTISTATQMSTAATARRNYPPAEALAVLEASAGLEV